MARRDSVSDVSSLDVECDSKFRSVTTLTQKSDKKEQHAGPTTPCGRLPWLSIAWRLFSVQLFCGLILVVLLVFAKRESLSSEDKWHFNAFAILLSSLVSVSVGSLIGLLGSMLRWPILAAEDHSPRSVDLILGMADPAGSFRLACHHLRGRKTRWTTTSLVVVLYLVFNVLGRLSVAAIGLSFDLNETGVIEHPVRISYWDTNKWLQGMRYGGDTGTKVNFEKYASTAFLSLPVLYDWFRDRPEVSETRELRVTNFSNTGIDWVVSGNRITYSYAMREYQGEIVRGSTDTMLHSSSECVERTIYNGDLYEGSRKLHNIGWLENVTETSPEYERVLAMIYKRGQDAIWAAIIDPFAVATKNSSCLDTYLFVMKQTHLSVIRQERNASVFECNTCLSDRLDERLAGIRGNFFRGLSANESVYTMNTLLHLGPNGYGRPSDFDEHTLFRWRDMSQAQAGNWFGDFERYIPDTHPVLTTKISSPTVLYAADLAARVPVLTVMGAEASQPKVLKDEGSAAQRYVVELKLRVVWARAIGVVFAIQGGLLLSTAVVHFYCKNVFLRDHDSFLSVARILASAIVKVEGRTASSGKELARHMQELKLGMKYGSRKIGEDAFELDLLHTEGVTLRERFPREAKYT